MFLTTGVQLVRIGIICGSVNYCDGAFSDVIVAQRFNVGCNCWDVGDDGVVFYGAVLVCAVGVGAKFEPGYPYRKCLITW